MRTVLAILTALVAIPLLVSLVCLMYMTMFLSIQGLWLNSGVWRARWMLRRRGGVQGLNNCELALATALVRRRLAWKPLRRSPRWLAPTQRLLEELELLALSREAWALSAAPQIADTPA